VTPQLAAEGLARDLVRVIQQARRDADLNVSDRIVVVVDGPASVASALEAHAAFVAGETLANSVEMGTLVEGFAGDVGDNEPVKVTVTPV
jgi:isoleucyl-tRNA synthetase